MTSGSNVNAHFYPNAQQSGHQGGSVGHLGDINYTSPMRLKSAPLNQTGKEENPDELKLLQSRFKIDVQKSSSRGTSQQP